MEFWCCFIGCSPLSSDPEEEMESAGDPNIFGLHHRLLDAQSPRDDQNRIDRTLCVPLSADNTELSLRAGLGANMVLAKGLSPFDLAGFLSCPSSLDIPYPAAFLYPFLYPDPCRRPGSGSGAPARGYPVLSCSILAQGSPFRALSSSMQSFRC